MSILPRELASRYEVLAMMGEGGMGAVYKVRDNELDRICVIKVMHLQLQNNLALRQRFLGEAKKGAQVSHPNVAAVFDFFVGSNGTACLVMEYVDGKTLADILDHRAEPFDYKEAGEIVKQALAVVADLHARKLVHRDISPDNLMLTHDSAGNLLVKLIDLGIAKSLEESAASEGTGFFIGKGAYAPPEQFGNHVDARSDIYAMGVVLYKMLTKTLPIVANDFAGFYAAHHKNSPPRPFSETDPNGRVPEGVQRVVLKALEKKAEDRFQSADEFRDVLQRAIVSGATTVHEEAVRQPPVIAIEREPLARAIGVGIVATVLAGIALHYMWPHDVPVKPGRPPATQSNPPSETGIEVTGSVPPTNTPPAPNPVSSDAKRAASEITEGKRLAESGDMAGAFAAYERATKDDPSSAFGWANLGAAAAMLGRPADAAQAYRRSFAIDPDNWLAHYNLGCQLAREGKQDEAFSHIERAVLQLRQQVRSPKQLQSFLENIRTDQALKDLRNESRFTNLLAAN
ncbi:MAG TPA: serine/threonine-protein kinase [Thermoanaerobaculia bacterium]|jgi:serine/threonine-protein kinase|nr:serine/threonine-protein kinase [Thermoanaerobaculia bacterium]